MTGPRHIDGRDTTSMNVYDDHDNHDFPEPSGQMLVRTQGTEQSHVTSALQVYLCTIHVKHGLALSTIDFDLSEKAEKGKGKGASLFCNQPDGRV